VNFLARWHDGRMSEPTVRWMSQPLNAQDTRRALAGLTTAERERYETSPRPGSFLAGRLLLRDLIAELGAEGEIVAECPDCGGPHGKPMLRGSAPHLSPLHLSLSHGAGVVVAAASWNSPVGVDVEEAPSPAALAAIGIVTGEATLERWTRVEAILKADGRGLRVDPRRVTIEGDVGELDATRYALSEHTLAPGLRASVAIALAQP